MLYISRHLCIISSLKIFYLNTRCFKYWKSKILSRNREHHECSCIFLRLCNPKWYRVNKSHNESRLV